MDCFLKFYTAKTRCAPLRTRVCHLISLKTCAHKKQARACDMSTAALLGPVSGASHRDTVCPRYMTFLHSAALILDAEFRIKSDIAVGAVSSVYRARRSSVSARYH